MNSERLLAQRFDLETYVQKHAGQAIGRGEYLLTCPLCGKKKLTVNVEKRLWHCWVCEEYESRPGGKKVPVRGAGGVIALVMTLENVTYERAVTLLSYQVGAAAAPGHLEHLDCEIATNYQVSRGTRPAPEIQLPPYTRPVYGILPYCRQRGITEEDARIFGLAFCEGGRYAQRLIIPVWELGRVVYFQARATWQEMPGERYIKALNPPHVPGTAGAGDVLLNLDIARQYRRVAITEGPIDAIHTGYDAVCTFGKKISPVQIWKLKQAGVQAIDLMWDGPTAGEPQGAWPEMLRAARGLAGVFRDVRLVFLPQGDPGDYSRDQLNWFRAYHARPVSQISGLARL